MTVALTLFGAPTIAHGGRSIALDRERRTQLLVYLALKRNWVGRAELAALLWPDQDSKLAYTNLRKALHRLQSLPWAAGLRNQGSALQFEADTDVHAFESALRERRLSDAIALYGGPLLAGFDDSGNEAWSSWLDFERHRLQATWRAAVQEHLAGDVAAVEAVDLATRLLDADPLDDAAVRMLMTWLARAGQTARMRQVFSGFVARLADELGLEPSAELTALHDELNAASSGAAENHRPAARAAATRAAAAKSDDSFIGRTVELRRVASLLAQDDCRLLTVTGPGGVGKSRLAHRVVTEFAGDFSDGAVYVPLDDLTLGDELGGRLAREIDIPLKGRADPMDQVADALRTCEKLLVLDNFEQIVDAAPLLGRLLAACPKVCAVVTSRVRLGLASEWLLPLAGLPYPEDEDRDELESFDAARLFVRAARRVQPNLVPATEASAIIEICRLVEGLPLALELAAAWTRVLSCADIAHQLRHGTDLLQATDSTRPERHASIEVVFEQSWQLLTDIERQVLAKLSVFHGSFTPEAARAVAGAPLPVLGALVDKSLLYREGGRLRLHPLVQQFAAARLVSDAGGLAAGAAHAAHYHCWLCQIERAVSHSDRRSHQAIDLEFDNIRRAWQWAIEQHKVTLLAQSVKALVDYCDHRGRSAEGLALLQDAMQSSAVHRDGSLHALLLSKASHLEYRLDRYAEAEVHARNALAAARRPHDEAVKLQALNVLGTCAFRFGRLTEARRHFEELLEVGSSVDPVALVANTMDHLALIEKAEGRYDEALRLSLSALVEYRRIGDSAEEALCLNNLGSLQILRGDTTAAAAHLREGLSICERDGLIGTQAFLLANLTEVATRHGELTEAHGLAERAIQVATVVGNRAVAAWACIKAARLAALNGDLVRARTILAEAMTTVSALGVLLLKFDGVACLAQILAAQGEGACAVAVLGFAISHPQATPATRDEMSARLAYLRIEPQQASPWPAIDLDEILHRIVAEAGQAYTPLIALLEGKSSTGARHP